MYGVLRFLYMEMEVLDQSVWMYIEGSSTLVHGLQIQADRSRRKGGGAESNTL